MNGGNFNLATRNPFKIPNSRPKITINGMVTANAAVTEVVVRQIVPAITDEAIKTVPMDKSIPPVAITKVTPKPKIA